MFYASYIFKGYFLTFYITGVDIKLLFLTETFNIYSALVVMCICDGH